MLKQLYYFQAVVRTGSFTEAAAECYISQSAISQQVQALERELGFALLERRGRSFALTPAGEYFYRRSLVLVSDYERLCQEAGKIAKGNEAVLKVGYLRGYTGPEFAQALEAFAAAVPEVEVRVQYGSHEELYTLLRTGQADLVLNDQRRAFSAEYVNLVLTSCAAAVEVSARSPLAQLPAVTPQELKNLPCILVADAGQQTTEQEFYSTVLGFAGDFLFAETPEEAHMMILGRRGFMPVEGDSRRPAPPPLARIPLTAGPVPGCCKSSSGIENGRSVLAGRPFI